MQKDKAIFERTQKNSFQNLQRNKNSHPKEKALRAEEAHPQGGKEHFEIHIRSKEGSAREDSLQLKWALKM